MLQLKNELFVGTVKTETGKNHPLVTKPWEIFDKEHIYVALFPTDCV